jgi:hypothetical protein
MKATSFTFPFKYLAKKIIAWAMSTSILAFPRRIINSAIAYAISLKQEQSCEATIICNDPERAKVIELIRKIRHEREMLLDDNDAYHIYRTVMATKKVNGDIAEVGVYQGASAKLICEAKGGKELHLFDTFEGLPGLSNADNPDRLHKGQFLAEFEEVKDYLRAYPNVRFYKGPFPDTAEPIKNKVFSFVNLDADLYESTLSCLKFFYPRTSKGGIIISHDYTDSSIPGVKRAFDNFFEDKEETIIEISGLTGSQCLIVKL